MGQMIALANNATTLVLNGEIIGDLVEDEQIVVSYPNAVTNRSNASGGVTVINAENRGVAVLTIKVQRYSTSDVLLNSWLKGEGDYPKIINGSSRTRLQRDGAEVFETYRFEGGTFTDRGDNSKHGNEAGGEMEYSIEFRQSDRSL